MSNNTQINQNVTSGDIIATEDVGGVKYELVKLVDSTAGSTARTGVAASPLQVSLANTAANATAVKVDGSAVTQPVSGTVTANAGTDLNTSLLALEAGGNLEAVAASLSVLDDWDESDRAKVNIIVGNEGVSSNSGTKDAGTVRVVLATDQPQLTNKLLVTPDANSAVNLGQVGGTATDTNSGNKSAGTIRVVLATDQPALTNKLLVTPDANSSVNLNQIAGNGVSAGNGASGTGVQRVTIANDSTGVVSPTPKTSGGLSVGKLISAATLNATSLKGSAGQLYSVFAHNVNAAARFLKFYNKATAPTVGSDTPVMTLPIPGNTAGAGFTFDTGGMGVAFSTGIAYAVTGAVADNDTTSIAASEVVLAILYN